MIASGKLKHYCRLEIPLTVYDWGGGGTISWILYKNIWAEILPMRGIEKYNDDKNKPELTHRIKIRYLNGITPSMRIVFNDRIFKIKAILNDAEENRILNIEAKEVTGERES